jgi:hypothetical protein
MLNIVPKARPHITNHRATKTLLIIAVSILKKL